MRHDLGEYYTPDWLAEHVLNELGYEGDPDKRLLDPACGSGTFLVMAINRIRRWYEANREKCAYDQGELLNKILANVIGFDLNPLAVMAARTNYLVAIKDLIRHSGHVEIPVYLCDSIMTPAEYGDLFTGAGNVAKVPCSALKPPHLLVPKEIAKSPREVAQYAAVLETCIKNAYAAEEFLNRCRDEGLTIAATATHLDLYKELVRLDKENKNGIWARIIKNNFAPLFVGALDYVVGNPPWVNWESLPAEYRESTVELWDRYRLRERAAKGARLGNVKKELSALFVYVCLDYYVKRAGSLGFVITQSVFKTGANEGFRRFTLKPKELFRVLSVSDLSLSLPFESATNRTAVLVTRKDELTKYPIPYAFWVPNAPRHATEDGDLKTILRQYEVQDWFAAPVEPSVIGSTWLTAPRKAFPVLQKLIGDRAETIMERAYAGSCTWLNGVFWVEVINSSGRRRTIRNLGDVGRTKVEISTTTIEDSYVFPLLRGRDVHAWHAAPSAHIIVPHDEHDFSRPVSLTELKRKAPLTFQFFKEFEKQLRKRSGYKQIHKERPEFYVLGNLGNYTLTPYKVIFKDLTEVFQCAVVGPTSAHGSDVKPVIPDHTLLFLTCESRNEAYFLAGILNSIPCRTALYSASGGVQTQRYFPTDVSRIRLPAFDSKDKNHQGIVALSLLCHTLAEQNKLADTPSKEEFELAEKVAPIWNIRSNELQRVSDYYREILAFRGTREFEDPEADV